MTGKVWSPGDAVGSIASEAKPWIKGLARLGYVAKGIVYVVVGIVAINAALTRTGDPEGTDGALAVIIRQPFGRVLLGIVAVGLVGYTVWRLVMAISDPENRGTDAKGLVVRGGYLLSAVLHAGLALGAARLVMNGGGGAGGGEDEQASNWTALVMGQPAGRWVIAAVGAGIILFGLYELYRAATEDLIERMNLMGHPFDTRKNLERLGRLGLAARGIVFGIIGWFLIQAALNYNPEEARGLDGALETLERQPYGPYLLGLVAVGLFAYGVFQMAKGRYGVIATG